MSLFNERIVCVSAGLVARTVESLQWVARQPAWSDDEVAAWVQRGQPVLDKMASRTNPGSELAFLLEGEVQELINYLIWVASQPVKTEAEVAEWSEYGQPVLDEWRALRAGGFWEHDLSLLTAEERAIFAQWDGGDAEWQRGAILELARAITAARSERKLMRGALTAIAGSIYPAGNGTPLVGLIFEVTKHALGDEKLEDGEEYENCTKYLVAIGSDYPEQLRRQSEKAVSDGRAD